jgi:hypothetical protein
MESASSGAEQLMFRTGQLREESNMFWSLDFKNYHGLQTVSDIPYVSINTVSCKRLEEKQLDQYRNLIKYLKPLVKDTICFQLIAMVMLLDTSDLMDYHYTPVDVCTNQISDGVQAPSYALQKRKKSNTYAFRNMEQRFEEINALQKHYIKLFHNRCMYQDTSELRSFGETDERLNRTMMNIKEISYYIPLLVQ